MVLTRHHIVIALTGILVAIIGLLALWQRTQAPRETRETLYMFGTLVEIVIRDADKDTATAAIGAVDREFQHMQRDWHAWKPGELTRANAALAAGRSVTVSPFLLPLIREAKTLAARSDGLFDPAIGAVIAAWGFHSDDLPDGTMPPMERIRDLAAKAPRMADITIQGNRISSANPAVQLDFGGFAKGAALDRAVVILREFGIENAIVNAGGDMNIMGRAGERPWRIGIRHPKQGGLIASVALTGNENIYTSGNYFRFRQHDGVKYSHIIDPRDGMPVRHIVSASVIHPSGAVADAAATALSVAGPDDWQPIARRMGVELVLLVDDRGKIHASPAMAERVELIDVARSNLVVAKTAGF